MSELSAVVRFIHLTAAVLLVGSFSFALLVARPAYSSVAGDAKSDYLWFLNLQLRIARWYLIAIFVSALFGLWLQTLTVSESSAGFSFAVNAIFHLLRKPNTAKSGWRGWHSFVLSAHCSGWPKRIKSLPFFLLSISASRVPAGLPGSRGSCLPAEGTAFIIQVSADALHLLASGILARRTAATR